MLTAYASNSAGKVADDTGTQLVQLIELVITKIPLWITALIFVFATILLAKMARVMVENKLAEKGLEEDHREVQILGGRMAYSVVLTLGITIALKIAGIDLTSIIAAVAFGVGFALKDLIMNFLAGVMILLSRHFTIGDYIKVGDSLGRVVEIQSRVTILQAIDGTKVIVPNADIFSQKVVSMTGNPFRRIEVEVGVDYRANLENAMKLCLETAKSTKGILADPKPMVLIGEWGDYEIIIKVRAWVDSRSGWLKIKSDLLKNLKLAYDKYEINYAWPVTQLVMDKDIQAPEKTFQAGEKPFIRETEEEIMLSEELEANAQVSATSSPQAVPAPVATPTPVIPAPVEEKEDKPLRPIVENGL